MTLVNCEEYAHGHEITKLLGSRNVPKLDRRIAYVKPRDFGTIQQLNK